MPADKNDLIPNEFPKDLNWTNDEAIASLEKIYLFVNEECTHAINWYYQKKNQKKIYGYLFRIGAILSVTVSGIIPVLSEIFRTEDASFISPAWATVALAFAALLISVDRFGGYTSGWIRYIRTGQYLDSLQDNFRIDWEKERMVLQNSKSGNIVVGDALKKCLEFMSQVNNAVSTETEAWAKEFEKVLVDFDKKIKAKTVKKP